MNHVDGIRFPQNAAGIPCCHLPGRISESDVKPCMLPLLRHEYVRKLKLPMHEAHPFSNAF